QIRLLLLTLASHLECRKTEAHTGARASGKRTLIDRRRERADRIRAASSRLKSGKGRSQANRLGNTPRCSKICSSQLGEVHETAARFVRNSGNSISIRVPRPGSLSIHIR